MKYRIAESSTDQLAQNKTSGVNSQDEICGKYYVQLVFILFTLLVFRPNMGLDSFR